jgi:uncharacterized membrane protein
MKLPIWMVAGFLASCTLPEVKDIPAEPVSQDTSHLQATGTYSAAAKTDPLPIKQPKQVPEPKGIYHGLLKLNENVDQTIAFYPDYTYHLQEIYQVNKKDSIILTNGNWSPSDGFIWLYKDQVERGRYQWKGDTLQYYNPSSKKGITMNPVADIMETKTWLKKKKEGIIFSGVGNEPFWSIQYLQDSLEFSMADWSQPVHLKINQTLSTADSISYVAQSDSNQLTVTVYPYFCSDGMSDFIYRNKIRVQFNNQVYHGCGVKFR